MVLFGAAELYMSRSCVFASFVNGFIFSGTANGLVVRSMKHC